MLASVQYVSAISPVKCGGGAWGYYDVMNEKQLTEAQKIEILHRSEYDKCGDSVAEEGMLAQGCETPKQI